MLSRPHCEKDITHELEREGMSVINAVKDDLQETNEIRKEAENMVEYLKKLRSNTDAVEFFEKENTNYLIFPCHIHRYTKWFLNLYLLTVNSQKKERKSQQAS